MARLVTSGFETALSGGTDVSLSTEGEGFSTAGGAASRGPDSTHVRSGQMALKIAPSANSGRIFWSQTLGSTNTYFWRAYVYFTSFPGSNTQDFMGMDNGATGVFLSASGGTITLNNWSSNAVVGTSGSTLSLNQWYRIEVQYKPNTGAAQVFVDGVSVISVTAETSTSLNEVYLGGWNTDTWTAWFDDVALNDSTGVNQSGLPGAGKVVLLKPVSDNSRTGWTAGAGGTTNLFSAVSNIPPAGVAQASETNTSQITDAVSNTTDTYVANVGAYTTALASGGGGMGASDSVTLVAAIASGAQGSTTSQTLATNVTSNPAGTEGTAASSATAAGAFPTNWTALRSAYSYAPAVTLGNQPTVQVRKGTATVNQAFYDFMGLYVEYVPGVAGGGGWVPPVLSQRMTYI